MGEGKVKLEDFLRETKMSVRLIPLKYQVCLFGRERDREGEKGLSPSVRHSLFPDAHFPQVKGKIFI